MDQLGQFGPKWVNISWCVCLSSLFIFCLWFCTFHFDSYIRSRFWLLLLLVVTLTLVI